MPWRISPPSTINSGAASCVRRAASQPLIVLAGVKDKAFDHLDIDPAKLFPVGTHESVNRIAAGTIARCMRFSSDQLLIKVMKLPKITLVIPVSRQARMFK